MFHPRRLQSSPIAASIATSLIVVLLAVQTTATTSTPSTTTPETTPTSAATPAVHVKTTAQEHPTTTETTIESTTDDTAQPLPPTTTTEPYTGPLKCFDGTIYDNQPLDDQLKRIKEKDCDGGLCLWSFGPWDGTMVLARYCANERQCASQIRLQSADYRVACCSTYLCNEDYDTAMATTTTTTTTTSTSSASTTISELFTRSNDHASVALQSAPSNLTSSSTSADHISSESSANTVSVPTTEPQATANPGSSAPHVWIALLVVGVVGSLVFALLSLLAFLGILCAPKQSTGLDVKPKELDKTLV